MSPETNRQTTASRRCLPGSPPGDLVAARKTSEWSLASPHALWSSTRRAEPDEKAADAVGEQQGVGVMLVLFRFVSSTGVGTRAARMM
jgi:hypothetical protein